jgi:hypothetical protein
MTYSEGKDSRVINHQFNVVDTLSVQKGSHSLKFGVDYRRLSPFSNPPVYTLEGAFASIAALDAGTTAFTFVLYSPNATFLFQNLGLFGQDTWRISPRLTITYGLRWDIDFTPSTENGPSIPAVTGFSLTDLSNLALAPAGTSIYGTRYGSIAPRVGAAYQISQRPDWGLVFRGGFGVFYDLSSTEVANADIYSYPFSNSIQPANVPFPTPPSVAALPPLLPPNATQGTLFGFNPNLEVPYSLQWSAAFEQGVGKAQTFKVSYVGSSGHRLLTSENVINPNPNYLTTTLVSNAGFSDYNSLQVQFQRRLYKGLQSLISYTWSHSIDTSSYGEYTNGSFLDVSSNKGDSEFDIRDTFSAAMTYDVPKVSGNAFLMAIANGWSTENVVQVHSAPPVDLLVGGFYSGLALGDKNILLRPDLVPGQPIYVYGPQYPGGKALNPNAFATPPLDPVTGFPTRQGNLGRDALRAFGLTQWDFAVHRDFPIREAMKLQFRAEMFNLLNHPNFGPFDYNFGVGDPHFGQSTAMANQATSGEVTANGGFSALYQLGGPRSIQLALKFIF